jgi:hypothetical protein
MPPALFVYGVPKNLSKPGSKPNNGITTRIVMLTTEKALYRGVPECVTRDHLTSPYFPTTRRSVLVVIGVLCLVFIATSLNRLHPTDLWGHLSFGRWIAEQGTLPTADPFGAQPIVAPYANTAWLAQWLGYQVHQLAGAEGLVLGHALLATLAFAGVMLAVRARGCSWFAAAGAGATAYILALPITGTIRPQLFGMVGFAGILLGCACLRTQRHPLIWLPLLMLVWANLHGSFLMGLVLLGGHAVSLTIERVWHREEQSAKVALRFWMVFVFSLAATCVNPHGASLLVNVASFGRNEVLTSISEWAALSTEKKLTLSLFSVSFLVGIAAFVWSPKRRELSDLLLFALFAVGTISAIRMLAWWALAWPCLVAPYLSAWLAQRFPANDETADEPTAMQTVIAMGLVFTTLLIAPCSHALITQHSRGAAQIHGTGTPLYVADELVRRETTGKMFAPMDWSDYLVWQTHARIQPLVYTHVHLLSTPVWEDYLRIAQGSPEWERLARQYSLRYVLADRDPKRKSELAKLVMLASRGDKPTARILYQDQRCILVELLPLKS